MSKTDLSRLLAEIERVRVVERASIHGPRHWARVERNGLYCARRCGGDEELVTLFALLHDARRFDDGADPEHGARAADFAASLNGTCFELDDARLEKLVYACAHHTSGRTSADPTIGACWDADRLDLTRIGIAPHPRFMSTQPGTELATSGDLSLVSTIPLRAL